MSDRFLEQRIGIKFYVKLGENASNICTLLSEAYGGETVKKTSVFEWCRRFREGRENVEDDAGSCHSRSHRNEIIEKMRDLVQSDRHVCNRGMAMQLNGDRETDKF
jgi:hypothetical protein